MLTLAAALLCGARWTTDSPSAVSGVYPGWRYLAWYGMGVYLIIATLLFIFYRPPATINHGNRSFMTRLLDFDKVGTLLWSASRPMLELTCKSPASSERFYR